MTLFSSVFLGLSFILTPYNVLDLSNLYIDHHQNEAHFYQPIEVTAHSQYTLVIADSVVGQYFDYMDQQTLLINGEMSDQTFLYDAYNHLFHMTFDVNEESLMLDHIPWNPYAALQIVLFQGTYDDFYGFTVYESPKVNEYVYIANQAFHAFQKELETEFHLIHQDINTYVYQRKGHEEYLIIYYVEVDIIPPVITGPDEIIVYDYQDPLDAVKILSYFNVLSDVSFTVDIIQNSYLETRIPGTYALLLSAEDALGQIATKNVKITVIKTTSDPVFLDAYLIEKAIFESMTQDDIMNYLYEHLNELNINGDIVIKSNNFTPSWTRQTFEIQYQVINEETLYEGIMQVTVNGWIEEEQKDVLLYTCMAIFVSTFGVIIYLKNKKKKV